MHRRQQAPAAIAALLALAVCSPAMAAFPGANGRIAFSGPTDIRTADPDGSGLQILAPGSEPAWSADGRRLAYRHEGAIHTIDADGSNATRLTTPFVVDIRPSWSPDGSKIAYSRVEFGGTFLIVMNADGSGERPIFVGFKVEARSPVWSPDGDQIAFERSPDIGIVNADGSGELTIIPFVPGAGAVRNHTLHLPDWSPDGSRLVFQRGTDGVDVDGPHDSDLVVVNADGTGRHVLTDDATPDAEPVWSPDGTKVLYAGGDGAFHTINPDGTGDTKLSFGGASPDWQPVTGPCSGASPAAQLAGLESAVDELPAGLRNSLRQKLAHARAAYDSGNLARARSVLRAFRHAVRAQAGKKIGRADANDLIAAANRLAQAIGC